MLMHKKIVVGLALATALALSIPTWAQAMMGGGGGGGMMSGIASAMGNMMGGNQQNRNVPPGAFIPGNPGGAPGYSGNPGYGNPGYGNPSYGNPGYGNPGYGNTGQGHMNGY